MSSRRVNFSPDQATLYPKHGGDGGGCGGGGGQKKRVILKVWSFKVPKGSRFSPARFFKEIRTEVARALNFATARRRCSRKVSSESFQRSRSYAETLDSQRAEAIEDCIEFLNYSSSLPRSNSVSSSC